MTATVQVNTAHGATPTLTDITGVNERHSTDDVYAASGTSNTLIVPSAGSNYGFWRQRRLNAISTPATAINNIKFYMPNADSSPTGITWLFQEANVGASAGYRIATGTVGTTGDVLSVGNHTGLTGAPVNPFTFTSGSPKSLSGSISNPSTGVFGSYWATQVVLATTVLPNGAFTAQSGTVAYDES